jgi:hypothetical protein
MYRMRDWKKVYAKISGAGSTRFAFGITQLAPLFGFPYRLVREVLFFE